MRVRVSVTPAAWWPASAVKEQFAISDRYQTAGIGDQPEHMSPLARSLPYRPGKRAMTPEDQAEREIARGGASL